MKLLAWTVGGLFAFVVLLTVMNNIEGGGPKAPTVQEQFASTAAACWQSYERKSLTPSEKRNIAAMCEGLEQRAKEK